MQRYFQFLVTFDIMLKYRPDNAKLHIQSLIQVIQTVVLVGGEFKKQRPPTLYTNRILQNPSLKSSDKQSHKASY